MLHRFRSLFARETSGGSVIPHIDGLRFIAIAAVIGYHIADNLRINQQRTDAEGDPLYWMFRHGGFGVQLFYAISGFILALPFATAHLSGRETPRLSKYYLRRVTRLEPPYIINLVVLAGLLVVMKHEPVKQTLEHLLASMFYVHNVVYHDMSTINPVAWSLEIEVQFYILAPILAMVFCIRHKLARRGVIIAIAAASMALQYVIADPHDHKHVGLTLAHQLHYFLVGFLLVDFHLNEWKTAGPRTALWDVVSAAAWAGLLLVLNYDWHYHVATAPLVFIAYIAAWRGPFWHWFYTRWAIYTIGGMCYTLYLWHPPIMGQLGKYTQRIHTGGPYWADFLVQLAIMAPIIIGVGAVLFVLFEKPFMKKDWPQRAWARVTGKPAPAPTGGR